MAVCVKKFIENKISVKTRKIILKTNTGFLNVTGNRLLIFEKFLLSLTQFVKVPHLFFEYQDDLSEQRVI